MAKKFRIKIASVFVTGISANTVPPTVPLANTPSSLISLALKECSSPINKSPSLESTSKSQRKSKKILGVKLESDIGITIAKVRPTIAKLAILKIGTCSPSKKSLPKF